jgi:hypothetical protein
MVTACIHPQGDSGPAAIGDEEYGRSENEQRRKFAGQQRQAVGLSTNEFLPPLGSPNFAGGPSLNSWAAKGFSGA